MGSSNNFPVIRSSDTGLDLRPEIKNVKVTSISARKCMNIIGRQVLMEGQEKTILERFSWIAPLYCLI